MLDIYFLGDSICFGQLFDISQTWVVQVATQLFAQSNRICAANKSINGDTTRQALERLQPDVLCYEPDVIYIQFGLNDCNVWKTDRGLPRVSPDAFVANLSEIIEKCLAYGVKHILLNTNHMTNRTHTHMPHTDIVYETVNQEYLALIRSVQSRYAGVIQPLDIAKYLASKQIAPDDYLLPDGIHLNAQGHQLYAEYVYPFLEDIVRQHVEIH